VPIFWAVVFLTIQNIQSNVCAMKRLLVATILLLVTIACGSSPLAPAPAAATPPASAQTPITIVVLAYNSTRPLPGVAVAVTPTTDSPAATWATLASRPLTLDTVSEHRVANTILTDTDGRATLAVVIGATYRLRVGKYETVMRVGPEHLIFWVQIEE
jgi:hypothetical protein